MAVNLPGRQAIIDLYTERFRGDDRVRALWLEGADGLGLADEYSDLDIWLDARDEDAPAVLADAVALARQMGPLDEYEEIPHEDGQIFQANLHVKGMSPYLTLDLCVQKHSRQGVCNFTIGDEAELPLTLLDKDGIIRMVAAKPLNSADLMAQRDRANARFTQRGRVTRYMARGLYLETLAHYEEYVLEPLVVLARLVHTPRHTEYGWTHITRHLPEALAGRFAALRSHRSLSDLPALLEAADALYGELNAAFSARYE